MTAEEVDPTEDEFSALLAAYDEALATGMPPAEWTSQRTPVALQRRLERDLACTQQVRAALQPSRCDAEPSSRLPWKTLGRFELRRELGRGGFGLVFLAYDPLLDREVALKVPHVEVVIRPELRERFQREARAASALDHPNLVPVFEVGEVGPVCFLVSAYCPGTSLDLWLKENVDPVPFSDAARLVATLAEAVQHAHSRGVLHRDLKPANVLLSIGDWRLATADLKSAIGNLQSAIPKITDFGLAKHFLGAGDGPEYQTRTGAVLGTPAYMAPEQAGGTKQPIGPAVDVYALGAILYELLTHRPPFQGESELETLVHAREDEPVPPSRLRPRVPRDLETICLKCLDKDPARRYASAGDLAEDLARFMRGGPVNARPVGRGERLWRWSRRKPLLAGLTLAVAVLLAAIAAVGTTAYVQTRTAWDREALAAADARQQRQEALEQRDAAHRYLYFAHMHLAEQAWKEGELGRLRELLDQYRPGAGQADLRGWEWYYLRSRNQDMLCLRGHQGMIRTVAWSPDGRRLASGGMDNMVRVWDASTGEQVAALREHTGQVNGVAWSPDGTRLATCSSDGTGRLWDTSNPTALWILREGSGWGSGVSWSPDGQRLASSHRPGSPVRVWQARDGQLLKTLPVSALAVGPVAWCPDGRHLAGGAASGDVLVWDLGHEGPARPLGRQDGRIMSLAWSPDGTRLASVCNDTTGRIWSLARDSHPIQLTGHAGTVWSVAWSPDGKRVATASADGTIRLWNPATGREVQTVRCHTGAAMAVAWSPDGTRLASGSMDETISVVRATPPEDGRTLTGHDEWVWGVTWSPDGRRLASAGDDRRVCIWDPSTGQKVRNLRGHENFVLAVAWAPDGGRVATADYDGKVKVWDPITGHEQGTLRGHVRPVRSVAWRPDARCLASGSDDGRVCLWDVDTRSRMRILTGHDGNVRHVAWSPDGGRLASASSDLTVRVWDPTSGKTLATLRGHHASVVAVAWSPDGAELASAGFDGTVKVWQMDNYAERRSLRGHAGAVLCLAWGGAGRLASGGGDIKIWDPSTGAEALALKGHTSAVQALAWSPDGKRLASASWDRTVKVWDASPAYR